MTNSKQGSLLQPKLIPENRPISPYARYIGRRLLKIVPSIMEILMMDRTIASIRVTRHDHEGGMFTVRVTYTDTEKPRVRYISSNNPEDVIKRAVEGRLDELDPNTPVPF